MSKYKGIMPLLLLAGLLVGCQKTPNSSQSSQKTATTKRPQSKASKTKTSSKQKTAQKSQNQQSKARLAQFNVKLREALGQILLPQEDGLDQDHDKLNVRYVKAANSAQIYYSVGKAPQAFNAEILKQEYPYAILTQTTYASVEKAAQQIAYQENTQNQGLPKVALGNGIQGTIEAGAGQRYLSWHQSGWSMVVHAASVMGQDPVPTAKKVVALIQKASLPKARGTMTLEVSTRYGDLNQEVTWREGIQVYCLQAHQIETAIKLLSNLNK